MNGNEVAWLELKFEGYWHAGTGQGGGPGLDQRVALSPDGLPVVSGRAVRGLLREAARTAVAVGRLDAQDVERWFGADIRVTAGDRQGKEQDAACFQEEIRFQTQEGALHIDNAVLGKGDDAAAWAVWARNHYVEASLLRVEFASTKIEEAGIATETSLRVIEVSVPMTLHAHLEGPPEALDAITSFCHLVREIGASRTRGLGRVSMTVKRGKA